ncbi:hypothetical protein NWE55_13730 [Myroides albus]|uniref:hypothetical protein n=1 Tax=Myroides albus TaxID=2562892 RepID=UPI0021591EB9|nr:hypothetical protein [Myroides albus]UVD79173.1 hypothetical protein NWE55_13730 [Myroides albus]
MKKRLLSVALLMTGSFSAYSQVGVGTIKPNKSAELTVESSNRGVLIPRLGLTGYQDRTTIINFPTNGINSLLVFNTASVKASGKEKGLTPGFYYWFIDQWVRLTNEGDIPDIVVNNFQEIVNKDGDKVKNIIKNIVNTTEGNVVYEDDKLYYIDSDGKKVEIKDKLTTIIYDKETGDYVYYNEGAVDRNGKIIGEGIRIEVKQTVINKFGDIINNKSVQDYITNFLDGTYVGGNVYYDGDKLTYVTNTGETKEVSIKDVVTANESKTVIITLEDKQYYVSESYLIANKGVVPTTVDPTNLPEGIYLIDVVGGVVNNFEEIVNNGPITVDGTTYQTINDYITHLTESTGGFTKIIYDATTGDAIFQEWDETTNSWVNVDNTKFNKIVTDNESKTVIITLEDKQYYVSESYLKANKGVVPTTVDPTNLPEGIYLIDVVGGVVNNFEEIVNNGPITVDGTTYQTINDYITHLTESTGGFTKIVYDATTGDAIFQEWDETTNSWVNVDNTKFNKIVTDNESKTVIITLEDKQYYVSESYLKANKGVVPTTVDPTNLPEGIYLIDVVGGVVNNFEEIVNNGPITVDGTTYQTINDYITHLTESTGGFTKIIYDATTGDAIFQEWDETTNSWVNVDNTKFNKIVTDNESKTVIITLEDKQYYVSESYLKANKGVVPTTVDPTNLPEGIYLIDVVGGVVNNFEEIVNNGPITVDGTTYQTINDYITHLTESTGGFTKIIYDATTGDAIFQEWDETTNSWVNVDNTKFNKIVTDNESKTVIITLEDKQYYVSESYLKANKGVVPTTVDPTNLPEGIYLIDVVGGVVNNFEEIVNNGPITVDGTTYQTINDYITHLTESTGGFTKIIYDATTGDAIFQEWDETTNSWVNVDNTKFNKIVTDNESKTVIITLEDKQYYVSESYLKANKGVVPTAVDPTNLPEGIYLIDVVGGVVNNFEEIVNNGPITVDGTTYQTINDYITHLTESTGGFTKIIYDATTGDAIFQEWDETTNSWVNVDNTKFNKIVTDNESKTVIITLEDKQYYVSESYLKANKGVVPTAVDPTNLPEGIYLIDVVGGVVNNFEEIVNNGPITVDGTTYQTINDYITHLTESTGGFTKIIYDATTGDAIFQEWDETTNSWINVDNTKFNKIVTDNESKTVIITLEDKQYYVSESYLKANKGVVPTAVDPTNLPEGIYLIDVVGGVVNNFEEIVNNGPITVDGTTYQTINDYITHLTESTGGFTKIIYDATTGDAIFQEWDETTNSWVNVDNTKFNKIVTDNESKTVIITLEDKQYYVSESYLKANKGVVPTTVDPTNLPEGIYLIDVVGGVVNNFEEIVNNGPITVDGTTYQTINDYITHLTESTGGFTKIIYDATTGDAIFQEWDETTNSWVNVDNTKFSTIVKTNETVTTLVENGDGTYTYYNEKEIDVNGQPLSGATGVTIDPKEVSVALDTTKQVYEFKNSNGDVIGEIDANANAIFYNDNSTNLGVTNVQGAIEKLLEKIKTVEGTTGNLVVSGGLEFTANTTGVEKLLADANIQVADKGITNEKLDEQSVTSDKMKATVADGNGGSKHAEEGMVPVANADGTVTYNKVNAKHVTYTKPTEDNGLVSNTVEGVINELAGKKGDLKVAGGMLTIDDGGKDALRHEATISLNLEGMNAIVETRVDYTAKVEDVIVLVLAESEDLVVTLPDATANKGKKYTIKKNDAKEDFYVTVKGNIEGASELYTALPYSGWDLVSDGTIWQIVNKF